MDSVIGDPLVIGILCSYSLRGITEINCKRRKRELRLIGCFDRVLSAMLGNFQWSISFNVHDAIASILSHRWKKWDSEAIKITSIHPSRRGHTEFHLSSLQRCYLPFMYFIYTDRLKDNIKLMS